MDNNKDNLIKDIIIIALSVLAATLLVKTHFLGKILVSTKEMEMIGSFVAGMFFTSIFTVVPATAVLGEIASENSVLLTAFFGGLGALVGDFIIFRFVRDRFSEHIINLITSEKGLARIKVLFRIKLFRWLAFLVGGLILASPLPDEIGIVLLGFSKTRTLFFIPISFGFNALGILIIGLVASFFF